MAHLILCTSHLDKGTEGLDNQYQSTKSAKKQVIVYRDQSDQRVEDV